MTSSLPTWLLYLQALSIPALAMVGAAIAFLQFRTAHTKLRLDLFEKRLVAYQTLVSLLGLALTHGTKADDKEVQDLYRLLPTVGFLFDDSIKKIAEDVVDAELKRRWAERRLASVKSGLEKHADESQRAFDQMRDIRQNLEAAFAPYLSFARIKTSFFW